MGVVIQFQYIVELKWGDYTIAMANLTDSWSRQWIEIIEHFVLKKTININFENLNQGLSTCFVSSLPISSIS